MKYMVVIAIQRLDVHTQLVDYNLGVFSSAAEQLVQWIVPVFNDMKIMPNDRTQM